jgi:hypothetical protein
LERQRFPFFTVFSPEVVPAKARTRLQDSIAVEIDDNLSFLQTRHSSRQQ